MDKKYRDRMKNTLLSAKEEIIKNLMNENKEFTQLVHDMEVKDLVDIAADDMDKRTIEALSGQDLKRLNMIDAALSRIHNDRYGVCVDCGQSISQERLDAIPYALKCISCQSRSERHRSE